MVRQNKHQNTVKVALAAQKLSLGIGITYSNHIFARPIHSITMYVREHPEHPNPKLQTKSFFLHF